MKKILLRSIFALLMVFVLAGGVSAQEMTAEETVPAEEETDKDTAPAEEEPDGEAVPAEQEADGETVPADCGKQTVTGSFQQCLRLQYITFSETGSWRIRSLFSMKRPVWSL